MCIILHLTCKGLTFPVIGGHSGIGKETVRALLAHNARVYVASRNEERAQEAIEELKKDTGNEAIFLQLDLADLKSVRRAADEFLTHEKVLNVLVNGA